MTKTRDFSVRKQSSKNTHRAKASKWSVSFARERGFAYGFIWACPPEKGDDYILHCKPEAQKTPNKQKLQKWYQDLLDSAERRGLIGEAEEGGSDMEVMSSPRSPSKVKPKP